MFLSATRIGEIFHLNGQEMNAVMCKLHILEGEPGNYGLTEFGKKFGRYNYYDNGYGGCAARGWETTSYDESIVDYLREKINKDVIQEAREQLKQHRLAQKTARDAEKAALEAEFLKKQQEKAAALAQPLRRPLHIPKGAVITGVVITAVLAAGLTWFFVHRSQEKKREAERKKAESENLINTQGEEAECSDTPIENGIAESETE